MNLINFISSLGINSISELRYKNPKLLNWILGVLMAYYIVEGIVLDKQWLSFTAFALWTTIKVSNDYKRSLFAANIHYIGAIAFFLPSVLYAGFWSLPLPLLITSILFFKHKQKDIHFLVFEVLLFLNTQILILI